MPRFAFKIEYDGAPFRGWQRQRDQPSVQGTIETALARLDPCRPVLTAAGRTDTGVHATGQVAHVDLVCDWKPHKLLGAVNFHLKPNPIAIVAATKVDDDFHARFSCTERRYIFRLVSRRAPAIHDLQKVWQVPYPLDISVMQDAARHLLGQHDFTTFRAVGCQGKTPVKTLDRLDITAHPYADGVEYRFDVRARSFLHSQVRSFVGTLERAGAGKWTAMDVKAALEARNRAACGTVAPPQGLYLSQACYGQDLLFK